MRPIKRVDRRAPATQQVECDKLRGHVKRPLALAPLFERPALTPRVTWGRAKPRPLAGSNPSDAARRNALRTCPSMSHLDRIETTIPDVQRQKGAIQFPPDTLGVRLRSIGQEILVLSVESAFGACALIPRPKGRGTSRFSVVPRARRLLRGAATRGGPTVIALRKC
jgi:hypothetical protein